MIATADFFKPAPRVLHKPKHGCGHGQPHLLAQPICRGQERGDHYAFSVGARCAPCGRTFIAPTTRVPTRFFLTRRGPDVVQQYVMRHGMAWIAHEAARK